MHLIDRYAYTNRLRSVDPAQKFALALTALLLCLILDRPLVGALVVAWMWGLSIFAGVPKRVLGHTLLAEAAFLALAVIGVAVSVSSAPPQAEWQTPLGSLWLSASQSSVDTALRLLTRALGGAAAMNWLALTTPLIDLIDLLRRLRVPLVLIDLMTLIYRFIFTLLDSLDRMRVAQDNRLGYVNFRRGLHSAAQLASRLFIETYLRSRRLQVALEGRGYAGDLRVLPHTYRTWPGLYALGVTMASSLIAISLIAIRVGL